MVALSDTDGDPEHCYDTGGPSTLSQGRRVVCALRAVLVPVAATALGVLTVSIGWRLSEAKLGCPPLPHVQICVSELLWVKKCPHYTAVGTVLAGCGLC